MNVVLNSDDGGNPLKSLMQNYNNNQQLLTSGTRYQPLRQQQVASAANRRDLAASEDQQTTNYQLELNKLLKCNYSGVSNLYYCDTASN